MLLLHIIHNSSPCGNPVFLQVNKKSTHLESRELLIFVVYKMMIDIVGVGFI